MKTDESFDQGQKSNQPIRNIDERNVKTREYKLFWMSFAAILMACGTHFFKYPNSFVIGGVEGMSIITSMFVPFNRPQLTLFYNVVLLVIGFFVIGKKFTIRTGYVAILNSLTALALERVFPINGSLTDNKMLELIFTLLMSSVGSAILFNLAASSGGTDIIAMIMKKYTSLEVGKSLLVVDSLFTIASIKIFGIEIGLFSILGLMMKGIFVDMIIGQMNTAKLFIIITSKTEEIGNFIKKELNRSATIVDARGLYRGTNISVFFCVTSTFESAKFRSFIKKIDPYSFITILNTSSIIGKGWYSSDDSLDSDEWLSKPFHTGKILVGRWFEMQKNIKILLLSFFTFILPLTSFASNDQQGNQKAGEKIIITETVAPVSKPEENPKDSAKKEENKADAKPDPNKKDDGKQADNKKEDSAYKDRREVPVDPKAQSPDKAQNPDMERIEKVVDDLVSKLDKNSNLSKALAEMQTSISTDNKASVKVKDVSKKTEQVLKDYNKKIQAATTEKQRKKLENEAADKIKSISENRPSSIDQEKLDEDIPEKKKKILLEVKPDREEDDADDRSQILALNPIDGEDEEVFFLENPIIIIALIFIISLIVVIGIVIRNNEKRDKRRKKK